MTADDKRGARRIVHLCTPARVGGLERVVQALSREQAARGHDVTVLAVVGDPATAEAFFEPFAGSGVRTIAMVFGGREYRRERRGIREAVLERRAHVVHTHGYRVELLHGGPLRRAGLAVVSTVHGSSRMGGLTHLMEWMQLRALRRFGGVVAVSSPLERTLLDVGVARDRLHRIPNVVPLAAAALPRDDARRALGLPTGTEPVLGWVGRIVPVKGMDVFLRAVALMPKGTHVISIIGDGPDRAPMEALARELGIADRVRFHGELPDSAKLLAAFDAFVLSSRSEGTPIVVLEAMRASLPIVATAVGGVPDVVQDPGTGWLVPPESPEALARAMGDVLADPGGAAARGRAGLDRLRREYDPGVWVARYDEVYERAITFRERDLR